MKKRTAMTMMGALLCAGTALANTFYVSTNGTSVTPYSSWATAATNIQFAVNVATNAGDTVLVTNGTYALASQIVVTNAITLESVNGSDVTIVDGQDLYRCLDLSGGCTLRGFCVTRGAGSLPIRCMGSNGDTKIEQCYFKFNHNASGFCILINGATVLRTEFWANTASSDAIRGVNSIFRNCLIHHNATSDNGLLSITGSSIDHCTIYSNGEVSQGDNVTFATSLIRNSILTKNPRSDVFGPSLSGSTLINCVYDTFNEAAGLPDELVDCIQAEQEAVGFSATGLSPESGTILHSTALPVDAGIWLGDAGCNKDFNGTLHGIDGNADGTSAPDIGAYEYVRSDMDSDEDGISDADEVEQGRSPLHDESRIIADAEAQGEAQGAADVTNNPAAYNLYTSNSITDLDMGTMMIQTSNGWMRMSLQLEQCTNLVDNVWTNAGDAVNWQLEAPDGKAFYRVRGAE